MAGLVAYFLGPYLDGRRPDRIAGYENSNAPVTGANTLYFEAADIHVWADAVDLSSPGADPATLAVLFHFTDPVRFIHFLPQMGTHIECGRSPCTGSSRTNICSSPSRGKPGSAGTSAKATCSTKCIGQPSVSCGHCASSGWKGCPPT